MFYIKDTLLPKVDNVVKFGVIVEQDNTPENDFELLKHLLNILRLKKVSHVLLICNETKAVKEFLDDDKAHLIDYYFKDTHSGTICMRPATCCADILQAILNGFKEILITSPLVNMKLHLDQLHEKFGIKYIIESNNNHGLGVSASWIRPEGIHLYEEICDKFLLDSDPEFVSLVLRAYQDRTYNLPIGNIITNLKMEEGQTMNPFIRYTFDNKRAYCGAECWRCNECYRSLNLSLQLNNILKKGSKEDGKDLP